MNALRIAPLLLAIGLAASGCATTPATGMLAADAPRTLPASGPVSVAWADPACFAELRYSPNRYEAARGNWLPELAEHLRKRAEPRLSPGERLDLTIVDVDRAGGYEPWIGVNHHDTRIVRDIYPPRMTVQFRHIGADGRVLAEGQRQLVDPGSHRHHSDRHHRPAALREGMIDAWLRRDWYRPR